MKKLILLCHFLLIPLHGEIIEVANFSEINKYVNRNSLIIVDIDDTLILPAQMLGGDTWFESRIEFLKTRGHHPTHAVNRTITEWVAIRHITKMNIVEEGTNQIISDLQAEGIPLIALTAQGVSTATPTKHHLETAGFDLAKTTPFSISHHQKINGWETLYSEGVIFTGGNSKGTTLSTIFEHFHYLPKRIVFIDDKLSGLLEVEQFTKKTGIEYIGLRYAYADKHKAEFRKEIADIQLANSTFERLLSDEEAELMLSRKTSK